MRSVDLPPTKLQVRLFGSLTVTIDRKPMPKLRTRSGNWLFALLILQRGQPVQREWLAQTLWPESSLLAARDNLRHSLSDLRKALGTEAVRLSAPTPTTLRLNIVEAEVDVLDFDAKIESGNVADTEHAVGLYQN